MSKIVFQKAGLSDLTLERGRSFPVSEPIEPNQERYLTEANSAKVIDYGAALKLIGLSFIGLTQDEYNGTTNGLKTWFESTQVNWSENSFTFIDERGTSRTVRLWDKQFNMKRIATGRFQVSLLFKEE